MTVQHPVAEIVGYELHVTRLGNSHEHRVPGPQVDSGWRPPSVPVTTNWWPWRWIGWWSIPRLMRRMRTRSPCRTISGVLAGPDFPLKVSQLNSMFMVFGTLMFGRTAYSCRMMTKSLSTRGL